MNGRAGVGVLTVVLVPVLLAGLLLWVLFFGAQPAVAACSPDLVSVDAAAIPPGAQVAGFGQAQLVNAALIVGAAAKLGMGGDAQLLGVQTAIGESTLRNLDHGDGAINPDGSVADSLGLFQQQSSWGTVDQRRDPGTAATLFFTRLAMVSSWQQMVPTLAINRVQGNQDPDYYSRFRDQATAVVHYLATLSPTATASSTAAAASPSPTAATAAVADGGGGCGGAISGDARTLAQGLLQQIKAGRLTVLEPRYEQEIANVAAGTQTSACGLDPRTLQLIDLALRTFRTVGVSDLNRRCTGSLLGAGTQSSHWINGGGQAVDFYNLGGAALTGGDPASMRFLHVLDQVVPAGARAGQVECRAPTSFVHLTQFADTCNHLHIDVAFTGNTPLTLTG
ncbi:hypothetical protein [Amnibacterium endophyticum]|uniref:Uncharacterized protein n=1 Tax=Amnibacterium endophyticum TaxID=2109337 RepID=A0ABW4LGQ8_9MICO